MRNLLLSAVLILTSLTQVHSQNTVRKEKLKHLFALMHQDSLMIKTFDAMSVSLVANMKTLLNDTAYTNHGVDISEIVKKFTEKNLQRSKVNALRLINEDMVDIYDKYFTVEEVEDYINFYQSKSGQKLLSVLPDITKDIMKVLTTKYQSDIKQTVGKDIEEMTAEITRQLNEKKQ